MSHGIEVRRARLGDEASLARLNGFVQALHRTHEPAVYKEPEAAEVAAWFATQLDADDVRVWVATAEGVPIGYVSVRVGPWEEHLFCHARTWWDVDQISVDPSWRRRGVARALLGEVAAEAEAAGVDRLLVSSQSFNSGAQEAWRRLGFEPQSTCFRVEPRRLLR